MSPKTYAAVAEGDFSLLRPAYCDDLVRVGRGHDGGYVVPRRIFARSAALLTLGVKDDWSFEAGALALNPALQVVCVDGTSSFLRIAVKALGQPFEAIGNLVKGRLWRVVKNLKYLSRPFEYLTFFRRHMLLRLMVTAQRSFSGQITPRELFDGPLGTLCPDERVIFKCDIEGGEYEVLPALKDHLERISALILEVHALEQPGHWPRFLALMQLLAEQFVVVHVHGNNFGGVFAGSGNPTCIELTLMRRELIDGPPTPASRAYPLEGLDMPNNRRVPDLAVTF